MDQTPGLVARHRSLQAKAANVLANSLLRDAGRAAEQFRRFATVTVLGAAGAAASVAAVAFLFRVEGLIGRRTMGSPLGDVAPMADKTYRKKLGNQFKDAVHRLRAMGAEVVVRICPDLGTLPAIPQPLRSFGGRA
ncbi:MAG: hypothetical protein M3021_12300 [Actinomycetota bacterium]|nr:hypothetical protein [Actinomycetota bacterium]